MTPAAQRELQAAQILGITFSGNNLTIGSIANNSPLLSLGLRAGDQITSLNGLPIFRATELLERLSSLASGDASASLSIMRDGTQQLLSVSSNLLDRIAQSQTTALNNLATQVNPQNNLNTTNNNDANQNNNIQPVDRTANARSGAPATSSAADLLRQSLQQGRSTTVGGTNTFGITNPSDNTTASGTTNAAANSGPPTAPAVANDTSGAAISQTSTGLIAPNAGVATPPGTITPPRANPDILPTGSFGTDNTTTGTTTTATPTTNTATPGATTGATTSSTATGSGAEISSTSTGLIAPSAGLATPPGTITPPKVPSSSITGDNTTTSPPAASNLPTTVLTPSGPRIAVPQSQSAAGRTAAPGSGPAGIGAPGQTGKVPVSPKAAAAAKAAAGAKAGRGGGAKASGGAKAGGAAGGAAATGT
jgi:hypothetical protein